MAERGYYDQNSTTQLATIQALQDWIDEAVATMPLPGSAGPITVLDPDGAGIT
jgi:hypothetical protein